MVKQLPFKQLTMVRFHVGAQKEEWPYGHFSFLVNLFV
jgi:hypothetical protein